MGRRDPQCSSEGCTHIAVVDQSVCVQHGGVPPARPPGPPAPIDHMRKCGATRKDGGVCTQPAMRGQARCYKHGGKYPNALAKAEEVVLEGKIIEAARKYGTPREVSPLDAMTEQLNDTMGHVDWLREQVARDGTNSALLSVYQAERAFLAKLSRDMVVLGVEDRKIKLQAEGIDALERAINNTLGELGVDVDTSWVREVLGRHLRLAFKSAAAGGPVAVPGSEMSREEADRMIRNAQDQPVDF
jgi:hypothetical protein